MTREAHRPEDRQRLDTLAGKLAELRPASASTLQAHAFYRAGMQAAKSESKPRRARRWLTSAAVAGLLVACSSVSYFAGLSRSKNSYLAASRPDSKKQGSVELPSSPTVEAATSQSVQSREPSPDSASELDRLPIVNWLPFPRLSPEQYAQMVESRTAPVRVNYLADDTRHPDGPADWLQRELHRTQSRSPLSRWFSM